jgi:Tfp pilus assembly protein PilV
MARVRWDEQGISLAEVLVAIPILVIGLLAVIAAISMGYSQVAFSGDQSKGTAYARQLMEQLKNRRVSNLVAAPPAPDTLDNGRFVRTPTVTVVFAGACPATPRLVRIDVSVAWSSQADGRRAAETVGLSTMKLEDPGCP